MNEVQELVASRLGSKTKAVLASSPGYAGMPPALQFVYAMLILIPMNLRLLKSEVAAWVDVFHALIGFYELADILIVLDEVLCLEVSNLARRLKFNPDVGDDHPVIIHLTASLWFRSKNLTITSSTSSARGPNNEQKKVAAAEKLESMGYCLTQERGRRPFLAPILENVTDKTRESAPPLIKQIWEFLEELLEELEIAEKRELTVGRFVTSANEVTIGGFWCEHSKG